jgi:hypothetical protein
MHRFWSFQVHIYTPSERNDIYDELKFSYVFLLCSQFSLYPEFS